MDDGHGRAVFEKVFAAIKASANVESAVNIFRDEYQVANATYHLAQTVTGNVDSPFVRTSYPEKWVARYLMRDYVKIDPIVQEGFARQLPFEWSELEPTPAAYELMMDAIANGVGPFGYSIPVTDKAGRRALFSINNASADEEWINKLTVNRENWAELAHLIHRKAITELHGDKDPLPQLGPREIECLTWTARGKSAKEIAILLGLSEHTTTTYLKSSRFKLVCSNLPEAVTKAIQMRIINP
ncbi:LuxR family transcriptional regulator [Rhizobium sp. LjRoot254]|uniref:LuxR family transcriptional regulator n=1 Tax=Rhizobium sp. LjRoot254 TaxID=3342297 RepID=UPI003ECC528A